MLSFAFGTKPESPGRLTAIARFLRKSLRFSAMDGSFLGVKKTLRKDKYQGVERLFLELHGQVDCIWDVLSVVADVDQRDSTVLADPLNSLAKQRSLEIVQALRCFI